MTCTGCSSQMVGVIVRLQTFPLIFVYILTFQPDDLQIFKYVANISCEVDFAKLWTSYT